MQGRTIIARRKRTKPSVMTTTGPCGARQDDPQTSKDAFASLSDELKREAWIAVLTFYDEHDRPRGWNTYEAVIRIDYDLGESDWKRVSECLKEGWLYQPNGLDGKPMRRRGKTTRKRNVYRITDLGREALSNAIER